MLDFFSALFDFSYMTPLDWDFLAAYLLVSALLALYIYRIDRKGALRHAALHRAARHSRRTLAADLERRY